MELRFRYEDCNEQRREAIVGEAEARRDEVEYATTAKVNEAKAIADGKAREAEARADGEARQIEAQEATKTAIVDGRVAVLRRLTFVGMLAASFYYVPDFWHNLPGAMVTISNNIIQALK